MTKHTKRRAFALLSVCLAVACSETPAAPLALNGDWEVQQIAGASLGEGVRIRMDIDARSGRMTGFTGCNEFNAEVTAFGDAISISAPAEADAPCPSPAAQTDETRFLAVLGSIARFSRHGRSLELLPREPGEALVRLRFSDVQDADGGN